MKPAKVSVSSFILAVGYARGVASKNELAPSISILVSLVISPYYCYMVKKPISIRHILCIRLFFCEKELRANVWQITGWGEGGSIITTSCDLFAESIVPVGMSGRIPPGWGDQRRKS